MKNLKPFWDKFEEFWKGKGKFPTAIFIIMIVVALLLQRSHSKNQVRENFDYNDFVEAVQQGKIEKVIITIDNDKPYYRIEGKFMDILNSYNEPDDKSNITKGENFSLIIRKEAKPEGLEIEDFFQKYKIKFAVKTKTDRAKNLVSFFLFFGLIAFVLFFFLRPTLLQNKHGDKYTKSSARPISAKGGYKNKETNITFNDIAGLKEAKEELQEIIDFLKNPTQFSKLGGRVPRGVLLAGPTGSGKTLLARAVAGEAEANFFSMSGSEFVEMFVGVGASRVRSLFSLARKNPPAIIFIDEIDAVGRHRGAGLGGGHDEREQTLNQLLVELDGFKQREGIILIGATNRPDMLDKALLRPGRFDRKVYTNLPDIEDREAILRVHTRNKPLAPNVDLKIIARGTPLFSGADLENLINEAALIAARKGKNEIEMKDLEWAKDKILMGAEKKIIITDEERTITAYHEAGHALVTLFCPEADPLHKVSIMPRGQALGITIQLPLLDKHTYSKNHLESKLTILMGGRVAEEIFLNQLTTGASNDIGVATGIAQKMVCDFGMSGLGPLSFGRKEGEIFMGRDFIQKQDYSEETAKKIDEEVKKLIDNAYKKAENILKQNKNDVIKLVELLLKKETLDGEEVKKLLNI